MKRFETNISKQKSEDDVVSKFDEKLARRLGEIAILLHLARTKEGDYAYDIRSKASDILFKQKRKSLEFIENHLHVLLDLRDLYKTNEEGSTSYKSKKTEIENSIMKHPIFMYNPRLSNILKNDDSDTIKQDLQYLDSVIMDFENTKKDIEISSTIWSNISGIYPAIDSLEKTGLILLKEESTESGRLKKIYCITKLGRKVLDRSLISMIDITSFIYRLEANRVMGKGVHSEFKITNPFRVLFRKLVHDVPPEHRNKILIRHKRPEGRPFFKMMTEHGSPLPNPHFLLRKPELIPGFLEHLENEDERKMTKEYFVTKLTEHKEEITKALEAIK